MINVFFFIPFKMSSLKKLDSKGELVKFRLES